jgi:hypothetical protein
MITETRQQAPATMQALQAWQDGISAILSCYNRQASQLDTFTVSVPRGAAEPTSQNRRSAPKQRSGHIKRPPFGADRAME